MVMDRDSPVSRAAADVRLRAGLASFWEASQRAHAPVAQSAPVEQWPRQCSELGPRRCCGSCTASPCCSAALGAASQLWPCSRRGWGWTPPCWASSSSRTGCTPPMKGARSAARPATHTCVPTGPEQCPEMRYSVLRCSAIWAAQGVSAGTGCLRPGTHWDARRTCACWREWPAHGKAAVPARRQTVSCELRAGGGLRVLPCSCCQSSSVSAGCDMRPAARLPRHPARAPACAVTGDGGEGCKIVWPTP